MDKECWSLQVTNVIWNADGGSSQVKTRRRGLIRELFNMKKKEIVELATEWVQTEGLHHISFRSLAEAVGIKSSSVHYHYKTKGDLVEELIRQYTTNLQAQFQELDQSKLECKDRLLRFAEIFESALSNDKVCLCGVLAVSITELTEGSASALESFFGMSQEWLEKTLSAGPELTIKLKPKQVASLLLSGLEGSLLLDRAQKGKSNLESQIAFIESLFALS